MALIELTSNLSRKDNPQKITKIIGRPSPTAIARDAERIGKFLISPKGLLFTAKQFAQQLMNPNTENIAGTAGIGLTKIYDPLSPLTNTIGAPLGLRTDRHMPPVVRANTSTYEGIHKARKASPKHSEVTNNRLVQLTDELLLGKTGKIGGLLSSIQSVGAFLGVKGAPIQTLSGLTGPKSLGGIGATTIRRFKDGNEPNLQDEFEIKLQTQPGLLGDTITEISGFKKEKKKVSLLGKYKALSYGQFPTRNHSTTIIDYRKLRDSGASTEDELEKALENSNYSRETNRQSNFNNALKLIKDINISKNNNLNGDESLITFRFNEITFKAYLGMLSDNYAPGWESTPDQGRADPRYHYTSFERTLSFDFMVAIESRNHANIIWQKLQDLALITHPVYGSEGFFGQTVNVTIGKLFDNRPMIIQDLGYDWDNENPWEIDPDRQHPLYTTVNMTCVILGNRPQSNSMLYDIPGLTNE